MDKAKILDYGTSLLFFGVAAIVAYQAQIMAYVPAEYSLLGLIIFGVLSQVVADARVKAKAYEFSAYIDDAQNKADEYQKLYEKANMKIDELQSKIEESA
jgi:hypothetical protein